MLFQLSAACGCSIGRLRRNNEDNFYFDGRFLPEVNSGLNGCIVKKSNLECDALYAVFDGMGGEEYGEKASYTAAKTAKEKANLSKQFAIGPRSFLNQFCNEANHAVCEQQKDLLVSRMGTTAAMLLFVPDEVYACNLGDSRIYRLRDDAFSQVSTDDTEHAPENFKRKAGLTQYLGVPEDELSLEPHIVKCDIKRGDVFLICSDGLTDMVSNVDICMILRQHISIKQCVQHLISEALKNGGHDNITVIAVRID
ncbi:MAG: serine/threonine-protein phosphatase [Clostridia bacterium]|nr:serine/threonine-protein phosphatase [Clostridia bacterium]